MIRKGFLMHVNGDSHQEYHRRHNPIWPELEDVLKAHGASNYSIFLDRARNLLFGYVEVEDEERWAAIAQTPECRKWWGYMKDVMVTNDDDSPVSEPLVEMFHLD